MARFLIILMLLGVSSVNHTPFEVINATAKPFIAGQPGAKSSMDIHLALLVSKPSKRLEFHKLVVSKNDLKIKVFDSRSEIITTFQKSDTLHIYSSYFFDKSQQEPLKNLDAEIIYSFRKKVRKKVISLEVLDKEFRK